MRDEKIERLALDYIRSITAQQSPGENVQFVSEILGALNVSIADLEVLGYIEGMDDEERLYSVAQTYEKLIETGDFSLGNGGALEHYYQATQEYVVDELDTRGLLWSSDVRVSRTIVTLMTDGE